MSIDLTNAVIASENDFALRMQLISFYQSNPLADLDPNAYMNYIYVIQGHSPYGNYKKRILERAGNLLERRRRKFQVALVPAVVAGATLFDIANTPVSPGPDSSIAGFAYAAGVRAAMFRSTVTTTTTRAYIQGQLLVTNASTNAIYYAGPIILNPSVQHGVVDFTQGFFLPDAPPMSPIGVGGFGTRFLLDNLQ